MTALPDWPRPQYKPGGGDALLYYALFGPPPASLAIDGRAYRWAGIPAGMALDEYDRAAQPGPFELLRDPLIAQGLAALGANVESVVLNSAECTLLHGSVADPRNLNYLRDSVGLIQFLLDHGAAAVLDVLTFTWYSTELWRERIFGPATAVPRNHVLIVESRDSGDSERLRYQTRGMRKFGRPDLSVTNVPDEMREIAIETCHHMIERQAFGRVVSENEEIALPGLPGGICCHYDGNLLDPNFNNVHIQIHFPS